MTQIFSSLKYINFLLLLQQITKNSNRNNTNLLSYSLDIRSLKSISLGSIQGVGRAEFLAEALGEIWFLIAFSFYSISAFLGWWSPSIFKVRILTITSLWCWLFCSSLSPLRTLVIILSPSYFKVSWLSNLNSIYNKIPAILGNIHRFPWWRHEHFRRLLFCLAHLGNQLFLLILLHFLMIFKKPSSTHGHMKNMLLKEWKERDGYKSYSYRAVI